VYEEQQKRAGQDTGKLRMTWADIRSAFGAGLFSAATVPNPKPNG
jgi:hypothetical protein